MTHSKPVWSERELPSFFRRWRTEWKDEELSPSNYLDHEGGLRFVLAAAWLFCPETVEYRGCVFLRENFSQDTVDDWFTSPAGERGRIEAVVNQVRLWDVFINASWTDDDQLGEELPQLALALGSAGRESCPRATRTVRSPSRSATRRTASMGRL